MDIPADARQFRVDRACPESLGFSERTTARLPFAVWVEPLPQPFRICSKECYLVTHLYGLQEDGTPGFISSVSGRSPAVCEHMGEFIE